MAFLDNSGDIIVDAVLTSNGRALLASGKANPLVTQFALSDTEIDYSLYDTANTSGSAYYDINIYTLPIFEANPSLSNLTSPLLTLVPGLQYLPVLKVNQSTKVSRDLTTIGTYTKAINIATTDAMINFVGSTNVASNTSWIDGRRNLLIGVSSVNQQSQTAATSRFIRVDQGYDSQTVAIPLGDLADTRFLVSVNRLFLKLLDRNYSSEGVRPAIVTNTFARSQSTNVYKISTTQTNFFGNVEVAPPINNVSQLATSLNTNIPDQVGPQMQFSLQASDFLASNLSYYFTNYGQLFTGNLDGYMTSVSSGDGVYAITTHVTITSENYGFSVNIPVKLFYKA